MKTNMLEALVQEIKTSSEVKTDMAKKIILWLILKSENFTKPVVVSIYTTNEEKMSFFDKLAKDTADSIETLNSGSRLHSFMQEMQETKYPLRLHFHGGMLFEKGTARAFVLSDCIIGVNEDVYTLWISSKSYDKSVEIIEFNLDEIEKIEL